MNTTTYPSPLDKLLTIGEPDPAQSQDWPDYLELGLGPEHIPDLLRMLTDDELLDPALLEGDEVKPEGWAPHHAMRALGQLRNLAAVEPLLNQSDKLLDYDKGLGEWGVEELPDVFGLIGPPAIPALIAHLANKSSGLDSRINASTALVRIAEMHPKAREKSITALSQQLEVAQENSPHLNAFIIDNLLHLKAVEAAPVIERAFATNSIDTSIVGDWDDVQAALGLKPPKERPPIRTLDELFPPFAQDSPSTLPSTKSHKQASEQKNKRKMAKLARKKNRKKK